MNELKTIEVCYQNSLLLISSELDDPQEALSNAETLWKLSRLPKHTDSITEFSSFSYYVSEDDDPVVSDIEHQDTTGIETPTEGEAIYQVKMTKEYRRYQGETKWNLYAIDFTAAVKIGGD